MLVQESLLFWKEIIDLNSNCPLASLDVESLFINIPSEETIDNMINDLLLTTDKVQNFAKDKLKQLFAAYESFFYDNNYYQQIAGVPIGSPMGLTLACAFFML